MKLFRFRYSPYARKVQILLDWLGADYELVEQSYGERSELARLTGGYIYVPVLVDDDGSVWTESRSICQRLLGRDDSRRFCPPHSEGPIWAFADFCDGALEDVLFRIASPEVQAAWSTPWERALYTLIKERKFGAGCLNAWLKERPALFARGRELLAPTLETLALQPYLFGEVPSYADAALYGELAMLHEADASFIDQLAPALSAYRLRLEQFRAARTG